MSSFLTVNLKSITLSDEEREAIGSMIGRTNRLPSADECRQFIVQHGIDTINHAMGAES